MPDWKADAEVSLKTALKTAELLRYKTSDDMESKRKELRRHDDIVGRYENDKNTPRSVRRKAYQERESAGADFIKSVNELGEQDYHISFLQDLEKRGAFPFQLLPLEIRRMILELLFIRETRIDLRAKPPSPERARRGSLAFLRTSRQMFDEASSIFYSKNEFLHRPEADSTRDLLRDLGGSLRNLVLNVTGYMDLSELRLLKSCQRLRRLHLLIHNVPSGRMPMSIALPNTTDLILSVTEWGDERERREKMRVKERLRVLLGRRGQALRRSMRLQARRTEQ